MNSLSGIEISASLALLYLIGTCLPLPLQTGTSVIMWHEAERLGLPIKSLFPPLPFSSTSSLAQTSSFTRGPGFWSFFPGFEWGFQLQDSTTYGLCILSERTTGLGPASKSHEQTDQNGGPRWSLGPFNTSRRGQVCDHYVCGHWTVISSKPPFFLGNLDLSRKV